MLVKVKLSRFMFNLLYNAHDLQEVILPDNFSCIFCSIMNTVVYFHFQFISFLISATRDGIPCYPDFQNLLDITLTTYKCNVLRTWKTSKQCCVLHSYGRAEFWKNQFYEVWTLSLWPNLISSLLQRHAWAFASPVSIWIPRTEENLSVRPFISRA